MLLLLRWSELHLTFAGVRTFSTIYCLLVSGDDIMTHLKEPLSLFAKCC